MPTNENGFPGSSAVQLWVFNVATNQWGQGWVSLVPGRVTRQWFVVLLPGMSGLTDRPGLCPGSSSSSTGLHQNLTSGNMNVLENNN